MKAYILHIIEEIQVKDGDLTGDYSSHLETKHYYSIWSEKYQAEKAFVQFLNTNKFCIEPILFDGISKLIEKEEHQLAIKIINKYSVAEIIYNNISFKKLFIEIIPSEFLGNIFD